MPDSQSSDEEDDQPLIEYARRSGLAHNHLSDPLPTLHLLPGSVHIGNKWLDDDQLPQVVFPDRLIEERLTVSKDAGKLLQWVTAVQFKSPNDADIALTFDDNDRKGKAAKALLELPLLKTDPAADRKRFARRESWEIKLQDIKLPLEIVDDERDEGVAIKPYLWHRGSEIIKDLKREKLLVTKNAGVVLRDAIIDKWTEEDSNNVWEKASMYKMTHMPEPVTPPLSPLLQSYIPKQPSLLDPSFDITTLSDPISLTQYDFNRIEEHISCQDLPTPLRNNRAQLEKETSSSTLCSPTMDRVRGSSESTNSSPHVSQKTKEINYDAMKVEETLTPPHPTFSPKSVHFNKIIETMQLEDFRTSESPCTKDFEGTFGDAAKKASQYTEQEKLIDADTVARVKVPYMDFSLPNPPWETFRDCKNAVEASSIQRAVIDAYVSSDIRAPWHLPRWLAMDLKWSPFPHSFAKVPDESFDHSDDILTAFIKDTVDDEIINSSSLTWKTPGLMILIDKQDDDDDEEVERGKFLMEMPEDLGVFLKKRKIAIEGNLKNGPIALRSLDPFETFPIKDYPQMTSQRPYNTTTESAQPSNEKMREDNSNLLTVGGQFSAVAALDNHLQIRDAKKPRLTDDAQLPAIRKRLVEHTSKPAIQTTTNKLVVSPLPCPQVLPTGPIGIIVSSKLFRNRSLMKKLTQRLPELILVERDNEAHNLTIWAPGTVARSPVESPLASEADIIVSPSTGIIITNLQKIKQRSLPGQNSKSTIRDDIAKVSLRYPRLVLLISENQLDDMTFGLDDNDCKAFSDFIGFVSGLDTTVIAQFIGGGEEALSKWLANTIVQYSAGGADLLEDTTHWELFLRRAGMNAFAAQTVLGCLKAPVGVDSHSLSKAGIYGVTAFVEMAQEQRLTRFGDMCGIAVLNRVGATLDAQWQ